MGKEFVKEEKVDRRNEKQKLRTSNYKKYVQGIDPDRKSNNNNFRKFGGNRQGEQGENNFYKNKNFNNLNQSQSNSNFNKKFNKKFGKDNDKIDEENTTGSHPIKKFNKKQKLTNDMIMEKLNFSFTRDAEWFKKTIQKIESVKEDLDRKFYPEEKKKGKIDFIRRLQNKIKDFKDAMKFAETYRKVRFFERRKLERMLTKINKEIEKFEQTESSCEDKEQYKISLKELNKKKENIIRDINYVKFYPKSYKYYALLPNKDKENAETLKKIEKMRKKIDFFVNLKKTNKEKNNQKEAQELISDSSEDESDEIIQFTKDDKMQIDDSNDAGNQEKQKVEREKSKKSEKKSKTKKEQIDALDYERESHNFRKKEKIEEDDFFIIDN